MEEFPFTDAEWGPLKVTADSILNAALAEDEPLAASLRLVMLDQVAELQERHGEHPVLLETAGDYTENDAERVPLYRRAIELAEANGLPALSIRLACVNALMSLGALVTALEELRACGGEAVGGGAEERAEWVRQLGYVAGHAESDADRVRVFRHGIAVALEHGLPALDLRLQLVRHLLDVGERAAALEELRSCRGGVAEANEDERTRWAGLLEEASRAEPGAAPDPAT